MNQLPVNKTQRLHSKLSLACIFIFALLLCNTVFAQVQKQAAAPATQARNHAENIVEVNYRDFPAREMISTETWNEFNPGTKATTSSYYKIFRGDATKFVEVVKKRNAFESFYINPADPAAFTMVKAIDPINFQRNGEWVNVDAQLRPIGNNVYEAPDQWNPVGVNVADAKTYIQTGAGHTRFNNWKLYGVNTNGKSLLAKADWSNYTVGADGIRITNIFPGIDAEMRVSRGGVKTSFIVHRLNYTQYQQLYFEDSFEGLTSKGLYFQNGQAGTHTEIVYADVPSETSAIKISPAFAFPKNQPLNVSEFPFEVSGNRISVVVPVQYLADNLLSGDVVIDPLVQSTNSIAQSTVGTMYNASCTWTASCDYAIAITPPAASTITNFLTEVYVVAAAPCGLNNFGYQVSTGTCISPGAGSVWINAGATGPGTMWAGFYDEPNLLACAPAASCTPTPINVNFRLFRTCVGPAGCDNTCVGLVNPLAVRIYGRTAELTGIVASATAECLGQNINFSTTAGYGVPPLSTISWSYSATGTPSIGTGPNISVGAALAPGAYTIYAKITDGCATTAQVSKAFTIKPIPVASLTTTTQTICEGASTNIAPSSTVGGTTYAWTVVQNGVTGAIAGTVTPIVQTLNNSGVALGNAIYTITPTANLCVGAPINDTVIVKFVNSVLYVDSTNGNDLNCGDSWGSAFKTLSRALKVANPSNNVDSILVAKGSYYPTGIKTGTNRDSSFAILRGGLKLFGGYPAGGGIRNITTNSTILSGDIAVANDSLDNSYHVMVIGGIAAAADSIVVDGFTITKGNATGTGQFNYGPTQLYQGHGGGMFMKNNLTARKTVLRNLRFITNTAVANGGGMNIVNAGPAIQNCTFANNRALSVGGGLTNEDQASPYVTGTNFTDNFASTYGGGVFTQNASSAAVFINCNINGNTSSWGAGIFNNNSTVVNISYCNINGNIGLNGGGGVYLSGSANGTLTNCIIANNVVKNAGGDIGSGGGLQTAGGTTTTLINCVIANNAANGTNDDGGGGIMLYGGTVNSINTTFAGNTTLSNPKPNSGGLSLVAGTVVNFRNSILWGGPAQHVHNLGTVNYDHSLVKGITATLPNLDLDPQFVNINNAIGPDGIWRTADDGLHLTPCSPAANMGSNALIPGGITTDASAAARIYNTTVDMGAYELQANPTPISFDNIIKTYGDPDAAVPNMVNCSGLPVTFTIADNTIATIVSGNLHIINAGVTTITAHTINGTADTTVMLTVNPRAVTVTVDAKTKVYGDADPAFTYTFSPALIAGDAFTGALTRVAGENIGVYAINQGTLTAGPNYTITFISENLTITPRSITVTANPQTKVYGDPDPVLSYTFTPALIAGDAFTGTLTRAPGEDIGVYAISQGTLALSSNYTLTYNGNSLTITPKAITVTATAQSKVYGDADPALTYTVTPALVAGDAFTGALTRVPGEDVGVYAINQATLALTSNYTLTYIGNNLTITPRIITVHATVQTKVYGDADPALTYTFSPALIAGDAFTGSLTRVPGENIGVYTINQGSLALSTNYTLIYIGNSLTITPKAITITANPQSKIYGDADPALTYTFTPALVAGDAFTGALTRVPGETVGVYAINQGTLTAGSNYTITYVSNNLTITLKTITITVNSQTKVYGDADPALTYTFSPALAAGDAFTGALSRVPGENIGVYAINQGTLTPGADYTIIFNSDNLTITPKTVTVTADAQTKVYGDPDPALTYTFSPALIAGDAFTGALTRVTGENIGVYAINQGTLTLSSNYTFIYNGSSLTITPKAITVTANSQTKIYGDVDPALTYTFSPALIAGDAFTGSLTRIPGENIGVYAINQGTLALSTNYTFTYVGNNLTITPKTITVNADIQTKVYGDADPALTYTFSPALIAGDAFTGSLTRVPGENIGVYAINQATLALSSNYTFIYNGNSLTITPKAITVTANSQTKIYGDADPALTYTFSPALIAGDAFTGGLIRIPGENIGVYAINQGTLTAGTNYTITYNGDNLTITPKTITITANAQTKVYGDADPALTYTFTPALIAGDAFTGALTRVPGENIGVYAINQGTLALSSNYTFIYNGDNLTITPKAITVTANAQTKVYGDPDPALTYTFAPALVGGDAFTGALTRVAGENVGVYAINQGTLVLSSNYTLTYIGNSLTITPKAITATANIQTKVYGDADPALTYTFAPALVAGDAFTGALTRVAGENVGVYAINQGTLALSSNYTLTYIGNTLTITRKTITVTANAQTKIYGAADPALTYTFTPALVAGDAFTGGLTRVPGENVGVYAINQGTLSLSTNYTFIYNGNSLTITPKAITATANPQTKIYGDADPALTYTFAPALVAGDAFTGGLTRAPGENVGVYAISQGTLALSTNYTLSFIGDNLIITPKNITVIADPKTKVYGDADPSLTYVYAPALIAGDAFTGALNRTAGENVGNYPINQNTLALSSNYQLNYVSADLVITKAVLTAIAGDKTVCLGSPVGTIPVSYTGFKNGDDASDINEPNVTIPSYSSAGNYPLIPSGGSSGNYSFVYVNGQLTVLPIPTGAITQTPVGPGVITGPGINNGVQLTAPSGAGYTWVWNTAETTGGIFVRTSGDFNVKVTNPEGCSIIFTTVVKQKTLIIPNIFSPNGDGIHDRWEIENLENHPGAVVQIYNRYGQIVHKIVNYTPWDGKVNGKDMTVGTYYYIIDPKNGQKPVTGFVDIIR
jgi:gliding motility-associated-like protein